MNFLQKDPTQVNSWELMLLQAANKISLSKSQYDLIEDRYENLQKILNNTTEPLLQEAHIFIQGSVGLKTTIKPASQAENDMATIDADAIILLPHAYQATAAEVFIAIENCFRSGSRVEHPIEPLRRGIRVVYADENPGFHIDITPARCVAGNTDTQGFGCLEVPDRKTGWKCSSPRSYSAWLDEISRKRINVALDSAVLLRKSNVVISEATQDPIPEYDEYVDGNPLRATIKLLKRHRDEWAIRQNQEENRPISAVITTLATKAYEEIAEESFANPLRPIDAIFEIVNRMPKFIEKIGGVYRVLNPRDHGENFAEKWNREDGEMYAKAFVEWHAFARNDLNIGFKDFGSADSFEGAMQKIFGLGKTFVNEITKEFPHNWKWPGRNDVSTNSISLGVFTGSSNKTTSSQQNTKVVGRLG